MKILYGLAGEGFGHSSRAREIIPYLQKKGHIVKVFTYGQSVCVLKKQGFDVFEVNGMHFHFEEGKLNHIKTIKKSLFSFLENLKKSNKIKDIMEENFDLCISDMEPLVPILSNWYNLPLLSIDNQHRLTNLELKVPLKFMKDFFIARYITNAFASRADWYIITSFSKGKIKSSYKKNTLIVPPIVRDKVKRLKSTNKDYILVYLTKKDVRVLQVLKEIKESFIIYGYDIEKNDKNLRFHKAGERFLNDLANCKAIIASSGFTLISEALYLKKPYLALPLTGHFEQVLNALFLKESSMGDYSEELSKSQIQSFLNNLDKYKKKIEKYQPDYNLLYDKLDEVLNKVKLYKQKEN